MSQMDIDVTAPEPTRADHGRQIWDDVVTAMVAEIDEEYGETIEEADVEGYLRDALDLADPYDEDEEFGFASDEDLADYLLELESVTAEDVYNYVFGQLPPGDKDEAEDEDESYGGPVLLISEAEEPAEVVVDPYYSSEEDEEPADRTEFDFVLGVARAADAGLDKYLADLPNLADLLAQTALMIKKITERKSKRSDAFPVPFFPVKFAHPADWPAFCRAMSIAKRPAISAKPAIKTKPVTEPAPRNRAVGFRAKPLGRSFLTRPPAQPMKPTPRKRAKAEPKAQKPTVYEFDFAIWDNPAYRQVPFRGKQLRTPSNKPGRSWPEIALDLDEMARQFGAVFAPSATQDALDNVGNAILATAMLFILAGRGNEVRKALAAAGFGNFGDAESVILEFLTLAYGIEGVRLAYAQLDTVLHLANIAAGARFRGRNGNEGRRYTFLNVYSWVRTFPKGPEHVYVEGIYKYNAKGKKQTELTRYAGFTRAPLVQSLAKKQEGGQSDDDQPGSKSSKSVGKSLYSHSAGHQKVLKLLAGDPKVTAALWRQVRGVDEDRRRDVHGDRFGAMGPIRLYNLMANVLLGQRDAIGKKTAQQIAADLIEAFACFFSAQRPPAGNAFRDFLPTASGASFGGLVTIIKQREGVQEADGDTLGAVAFALAKNTDSTLKTMDDLYAASPEQVAAAVAHLVRTNFNHADQPALHLAARTGRAWLVQLALDAGADVTAENAKGETAQAFVGKAAGEQVVAALSAAQKRQRGSQPGAMPEAWSAFSTKTKLGADWLTDADVRRLLIAANLADTELTAAVDIFAYRDALATFIRDNYLGQMAAGQIRRFTVVPVNFNNRHWATLVIEQNPARRSQPTVYFFDSLGSSAAKRELVLAMLRATGVYVNANALIDLSAALQGDGYTCGSWLVFAATTIVRGIAAGQNTATISGALAGFAATAQATHAANLLGRTA